jgi:hypothetical protein
LDAIAFFHSGAVDDLVTASIDLAITYKCDPYIFLDRPAEEINLLYRLTNERLMQQGGD